MLEIPSKPYVCDNLIGGRWRAAARGEVREVVSPYTNTVIGRVAMSGTEDVAAAVEAARPAAAAWRRTPIKERAQVLFRVRELLIKHAAELGASAAAEAGKTVAEGTAGVMKGVEVLEYALSLQNLDEGAAVEVSRGVTCEVRREPLGIVAGIGPFNFPAMVPMWMWPIAIAVGNAFVLKPSEKVPITSCRIGALLLEAGLPPGVFSIVHGGREAVEAVIDHPEIAAIGFVGSSAVAQQVYARAAQHGKRALALGGAKNPLIVVPDADPELTAQGVVDSFTGCAGQRCMAASLMVAVGDVDPLIDRIVERAKWLALGPGAGQMGAIIDRAQLERLHAGIERAVNDGAQLRLDGRNPTPPAGFTNGNWLGPTILDHADPSWACAKDELFGPVLTIVRVRTLEEALHLDATNAYGNACSVFTTRGQVARAVAERATAGMIGVNIGVPVPREPFSFGGTKTSRFGHGDITGAGGVEFWSQLKKITSKWAQQTDASWMS
jgi:malonate-semialdehyde dehydrogenase (acetylating)/methylmalonate-semialdehyde dehydrogenase